MFTKQIKRIKEKLIQARKADKDLDVFGADQHKYIVGNPVSTSVIKVFEEKHQISLPASYKCFLLEIGNGGSSVVNSAAGPFYGIYPLGVGMDDLIFEESGKYLKEDCQLYPKMSEEDWNALTHLAQQDDISDEDYDREQGKVFSGILSVGTQGCGNCHALVLNGKYKGKVLNLNSEISEFPPSFTYENNFLDWYERWLDEVISGKLFEANSWFGYRMAGNESDLFLKLRAAFSTQSKSSEILLAMFDLPAISLANANYLQEKLQRTTLVEEDENLMLSILSKFQFEIATPFLLDRLSSSDDKKNLPAIKAIYYYAKDKSKWADPIIKRLPTIKTEENLRFALYILEKSEVSYIPLLPPYCKSDIPAIRGIIYWHLGKSNTVSDYEVLFKKALETEEVSNIIRVLQALENNQSFVPYYKKLLLRIPNNAFVLSNIAHHLVALEDDKVYDAAIKNAYQSFFDTKENDSNHELRNCLISLKKMGKPMKTVVEYACHHLDVEVREAAKEVMKEWENHSKNNK